MPELSARAYRWALLGACAVAVVFQGVPLGRGFFFGDDYPNFAKAQADGLTGDFLSAPIYGHFAPGHRFLDWLIQSAAPLHWWAAAGLCLAALAASQLALAALVRELTRDAAASRWLALAAALLFGLHYLWHSAAIWWANAAHAVFAVPGVLAVMWLTARFHRTRSWVDLALAVVALGYVFLWYERGLFAPVYALAAVLCASAGPFLARLRRVAAAWPVWASLGFVCVLYLAFLRTHGQYATTASSVPLATWAEYLRENAVRVLLPGLANLSPYPDSEAQPQALAVVGVAVAVAVWAGLALWRGWRALIPLAIPATVVLTVVAFGYGRLPLWGAEATALTTRIFHDLAFLAVLALVLAVASTSPRRLRLSPRAAVAAGVAAVVLWAGAGAWSVAQQWRGFGASEVVAREYVGNLVGDLDELRAGEDTLTVQHPRVLGLEAQSTVEVARLADPGLSADDPDLTPWAAQPSGHLHPAEFGPAVTVVPQALQVPGVDDDPSDGCLPAGVYRFILPENDAGEWPSLQLRVDSVAVPEGGATVIDVVPLTPGSVGNYIHWDVSGPRIDPIPVMGDAVYVDLYLYAGGTCFGRFTLVPVR